MPKNVKLLQNAVNRQLCYINCTYSENKGIKFWLVIFFNTEDNSFICKSNIHKQRKWKGDGRIQGNKRNIYEWYEKDLHKAFSDRTNLSRISIPKKCYIMFFFQDYIYFTISCMHWTLNKLCNTYWIANVFFS